MSPKVVLAGNNTAAGYVLDLLLEACAATDILVIAPVADSVATWHSPLETTAIAAGVECLTPKDVNASEAVARIEHHAPGLFLSVDYTQILAVGTLDALSCPALNFHPSLLPRHRGVAPLIWALVEGDTTTGLTVHHLDNGVDTGPVVSQHRLPIHPDDTGYQLHLKMARLVRSTAAEIVRVWLAGESIPPGIEQTGVASYHSSRDPQVNHVDWQLDRARLRNIVRALAPPLPGAYAFAGDHRLVIASVSLVDSGPRPKPPGMVELRNGETVVWAADGPVRIDSFADDGAIVPGRELANTQLLMEGQILG